VKIAILSRNRRLYSTRRLIEAAEERGHEVRVIDVLRCYMNIVSKKPEVHLEGKKLEHIDAVIPRVGASVTAYGTSVLRQFEMMGTYTLIKDIIKMVGGAPVVIKLLEGTQGIGVVLAETTKAAESVIEAFMGLQANILVQEFIKEAGGADIRCLVVGGKVVAAMKRQAAEGEFRSNLHRGGSASLVKITPAERATAVSAAKVLGLSVAGVDLLRSERGPLVMEVNSSPGLEGIEAASGKDVAGIIIGELEKNARPHNTKTRGARG